MVMEVDEPAVAATTSQNQPQEHANDFDMDTSEGPIENDETFEPVDQINWKFNQVKGNIDADVHTEADVISCVEFSHDGEYLATGDKGGRVVIF